MKNKIRQYAKEKRNSLDIANSSLKIKNNLFSMPEYKTAKNILTYYSFGSEICTIEYFKDCSKNWFLPKIKGDDLLICPYCKDYLILNKYKIYEPATECISDLSILDMVIVPCLCADKKGYRIGYGKGYYDRFLKKLPHKPLKVVLTYSSLLLDCVYPDSFDVNCDFVITENEIYKV